MPAPAARGGDGAGGDGHRLAWLELEGDGGWSVLCDSGHGALGLVFGLSHGSTSRVYAEWRGEGGWWKITGLAPARPRAAWLWGETACAACASASASVTPPAARGAARSARDGSRVALRSRWGTTWPGSGSGWAAWGTDRYSVSWSDVDGPGGCGSHSCLLLLWRLSAIRLRVYALYGSTWLSSKNKKTQPIQLMMMRRNG